MAVCMLAALSCPAYGQAQAQPEPRDSPGKAAAVLPDDVLLILQRAKVPVDAVAVVVRDPLSGRERLSVNAQRPMNPASVIKLVTTYAALDQLGPSWVWKTPVWLDGLIQEPGAEGVLLGNLHIKGSGDPKLTLERSWALLQRVRQLGVREIRGDIVLDQSAFAAPSGGPGEFDGESLRTYNVQARALMFNQRSVIYTFVPDAARGVARVVAEPELAGVRVDATVPLAAGPCEDLRTLLKGQFSDPNMVRWAGRYPLSCGERQLAMAHPDPAGYDRRFLQALWSGMGGRLTGTVREGPAPARTPTFEWSSPPVAEVVRDINKFSNNTMAQQLALTLALEAPDSPEAHASVGPEQARAALQRWAQAKLPGTGLRIDNGSGLSREQRASADQVATLLQHAWVSPVLPELIASLPAAGAPDGTLRRMQRSAGRAHLKTGSLRDVVAVAGYALGRSGQRWIVVAMIHHEQASAARPAIESLVQWAINDGPPSQLKSSRRRGSP